MVRGKKRGTTRSDDGARLDAGIHALAPDEVAVPQQRADALSAPAEPSLFDALCASPVALVFTDEQWAARLAADKARWAREAAGLEPPSTVLVPERRDYLGEDDIEHAERAKDPFYRWAHY
jgi:hypothetical protein